MATCWSDNCGSEPAYRLVAVFWIDSRFGGESRGEIKMDGVACQEHRSAPASILCDEFWQRLESIAQFAGRPLVRADVTIESRSIG